MWGRGLAQNTHTDVHKERNFSINMHNLAKVQYTNARGLGNALYSQVDKSHANIYKLIIYH